VAGCCEHGNEPAGFSQRGECIDYLSARLFLKTAPNFCVVPRKKKNSGLHNVEMFLLMSCCVLKK
jgi:hypothetical protein